MACSACRRLFWNFWTDVIRGKQTFTGGKKQTIDKEGQGAKRFKSTTSKESKAKV